MYEQAHRRTESPIPRLRHRSKWLVALVSVVAMSCQRDPARQSSNDSPPAASASVNTSAAAKKKDSVYGLELPPSLHVTRRFDDTIYLTTSQSVNRVSEYLAKHVQVQHVEVNGSQSVFPRAYFEADANRTLVRIEITPLNGRTQVRIKDITPPPVTGGLNEPERWQQAGRNPDGSLKDRLRVD